MLPIINAVVLFATLVLLVVEEIRYRRFSKRVSETRHELLALAQKLRSPMATLKKYHAFLRNHEFGKLSFSQQEAIGKADAAFAEMTLFIERLLARSRIEDPSLSIQNKSINVVEACKTAIATVLPAAEQKSQSVTLARSKAYSVFIDPLLLHGILDELFVNAVHYTQEKGSIHVSIQEIGARGINVTIRDNGIGIPPSEKKHIFQKYFRGEKARKMADGNGLGLAFAKTFAETAGGSVRFVSSKGKGSTFIVTLPKARKK